MGIVENARLLVAALDLPVDAPVSASARLKTIAKDEKELTRVLDATRDLFDELTSGGVTPALLQTPWRDAKLVSVVDHWIAVLATFPILREHPTVWPTIREAKLKTLEQLASYPDMALPAKHAIRFALSLFNPSFLWECGKFELVPALRSWSEEDRKAFRAWLDDPWAP